jgi:hypothetical protein
MFREWPWANADDLNHSPEWGYDAVQRAFSQVDPTPPSQRPYSRVFPTWRVIKSH